MGDPTCAAAVGQESGLMAWLHKDMPRFDMELRQVGATFTMSDTATPYCTSLGPAHEKASLERVLHARDRSDVLVARRWRRVLAAYPGCQPLPEQSASLGPCSSRAHGYVAHRVAP